MNDDLQHLKLLSIFYYIVGGMAGLFACIPVIHVVMGIAMLSGLFDQPSGKAEPPPAFLGWLFIGLGSLFIILGWAFAIALILTGRWLRQQKHYIFCLVMAGIACLFQPMGLVLGIFSIIVLIRPSVKELFTKTASTSAGEAPNVA